MKVILLQKYKNLGHKNDIIDVSPGFARNYLIPKLIAERSSKSLEKNAIENKKQSEKKEEKLKANAKSIVEKLLNSKIQIKTKINDKGASFSSVSSNDIIKKIYDMFEYSVDDVIIPKKIDKIGVFEVVVKVYKEIKTDIKVEII